MLLCKLHGVQQWHLTIKQTSAAISATNPEFQTTVLVNNTQDVNGAVGDISTKALHLLAKVL